MIKLYHGDCLKRMAELEAESVNCCVTSPPYYGLRDYGHEGQIGLEQTPDEYVQKMVAVFREVWRVLRKDGTVWLNLGDSYNSGSGGYDDKYKGAMTGRKDKVENILKQKRLDSNLKHKDLIGIPWRVAFALQADGWYLRQDIIWHKPGPMPESVKDRCTKAHEYIFLLTKSARYWYDAEAIAEPAADPGDERHLRSDTRKLEERLCIDNGSRKRTGNATGDTRNRRSVWTVPTRSYPGAHFATFPPDLIKPCIKAGCPKTGTVLDPFFGSGTTGLVAQELGRRWVGIELSSEYCELAKLRIPAGYQTNLLELCNER